WQGARDFLRLLEFCFTEHIHDGDRDREVVELLEEARAFREPVLNWIVDHDQNGQLTLCLFRRLVPVEDEANALAFGLEDALLELDVDRAVGCHAYTLT